MDRVAGYMWNGRFQRGDTLVIRPQQPYFAHGHGLFETLRSHRGRPCFLGLHVDRMAGTADELALEVPFDGAQIREQVEELLARTGLAEARVKMHLLQRDDGRCELLITAAEVEAPARLQAGVAVGRASDRFNGMTAMPGLKTMNYMANRLAEAEGRGRGLAEVIFTLPDGTVTEGTRSTVFLVGDGMIRTPPLSVPILPGVTRMVVLDLCRELEIPVREERFPYAALLAADEVFLTGSVGGIRPVRSLDDRRFEPAPGPLTARVAEAYGDRLEGDPEWGEG